MDNIWEKIKYISADVEVKLRPPNDCATWEAEITVDGKRVGVGAAKEPRRAVRKAYAFYLAQRSTRSS